MEQKAILQLIGIITYIIFPLFLSNPLTIELFEEVDSIPRVGDMWILMAANSPSCCARFFIPRIDVSFVVGDKIVRIEHSRTESKALVWRLGRNIDGKWLWNFEHGERIQYEFHQLFVGSYVIINDDPNQELELY
jgi:hypothetical protein